LAVRLADLVAGDHVTVLLARARETGATIGIAVLRLQPSVWSRAQEVYLAELYVRPSWRGQGYGRELITEAMRVARGGRRLRLPGDE
jgi:GNAT superfamily N-acetyltransferase